jgi:hypothetical protein
MSAAANNLKSLILAPNVEVRVLPHAPAGPVLRRYRASGGFATTANINGKYHRFTDKVNKARLPIVKVLPS